MSEPVSEEVLLQIINSMISLSEHELRNGAEASFGKMVLVPPPPSENIAILMPELNGYDSLHHAMREVVGIISGKKEIPQIPEISAFIVAIEAWAVLIDKDDDNALERALTTEPSKHPERFDVLIGQAFDPNGTRAFVSKRIVRDEDGMFVGLEDYVPASEELQASASSFDPWLAIRSKKRRGPYA